MSGLALITVRPTVAIEKPNGYEFITLPEPTGLSWAEGMQYLIQKTCEAFQVQPEDLILARQQPLSVYDTRLFQRASRRRTP